MANSDASCATKFHCVSCGHVWGDGIDIGSAGFCLECFAAWAKNKKDCFGLNNCMLVSCNLTKYCKEYYGIR